MTPAGLVLLTYLSDHDGHRAWRTGGRLRHG